MFSEFPSSSCPSTKWLRDPFIEAGLSAVAAAFLPRERGQRTGCQVLPVPRVSEAVLSIQTGISSLMLSPSCLEEPSILGEDKGLETLPFCSLCPCSTQAAPRAVCLCRASASPAREVLMPYIFVITSQADRSRSKREQKASGSGNEGFIVPGVKAVARGVCRLGTLSGQVRAATRPSPWPSFPGQCQHCSEPGTAAGLVSLPSGLKAKCLLRRGR